MTALASVQEVAQALIRFRSVTPEDGGAIPWLAEALSGAGFRCETPRFGEPSILNLWARFGSARPCFVFAGHTDVVPPGDASLWRHDPFGGVISEGKVWGRGAADMKGGVAAAVAAAARFVMQPFRGSIAFLITGDEEGPAVDGTVRLLQWLRERGEPLDHCLLGEPTSVARLGDVVKHGRRGSLTGRLRVIGKQGHVAYPHLADNPSRALARVLDALHRPALDEGTADFDPTNLEVSSIDVGNPASNVIPGEIRIVFNVRFNDRWTAETLEAELRRRLAETGAAHDIRFDPSNAPAFLTARGDFTDLVARAVAEVTGEAPRFATNGGTSDARFIKSVCPVIELGLRSGNMHGIDEHADLGDLDALSRIYERVLERYFTPSARP